MAEQEYSVVVGRAWANEEGCGIHYSSDDERFVTREEAIAHGFRTVGSDDFNIGVWQGDNLVSLDWMSIPVDRDPAVLVGVVESLFF